MALLTVSNQGFTVHNHICGINFLSHLKGAPQTLCHSGMGRGGVVWGVQGTPAADIRKADQPLRGTENNKIGHSQECLCHKNRCIEHH